MYEKPLENARQSQKSGAVAQPGILEKTYGTDFRFYTGCVVFLLLCFAVPLYLAGAFSSPQGWLGFGIVVICLGTSVVTSFLHRKWRVFLYTEGLVMTKGKQMRTVRWEEVDKVYRLDIPLPRVRYTIGSRPTQTLYIMRLHNDQTIEFGNDFADLDGLIKEIENRVQRHNAGA